MSRSRRIILLVARREVMLRLRSRAFRIGTIAMVALIAIGIVLFSTLQPGTSVSVAHVGFVGTATALEPVFKTEAAAAGTQVVVSDPADATTGTAQVDAGTLDVLITGSPTAPVAVVTDTVPSDVEQALITAVLEARLAAVGLTPATVTDVVDGTNVIVQPRKPASAPDPQRTGELLGALAVAILLYISLGFYGSLVAQGVVEEKSTRMVEILLATMRPSQLLAGKVIGIGSVGLLQLSIVGAATLIVGAVTHAVALPALSPLVVLGDLVWFTLGFLFYALAFAALAATVSRQEEVASATGPMNVFLVLGYLLVFLVLPDPGSAFSTFVSLLPPFAPVLMSVRIATGDAQGWQVALAVALLVASIGGLTWLAGRMYSNSVLRLGRRVRLGDAFRGH